MATKRFKKAFSIDTLISPFNSNNPYSVYGVNKDKDGNIWFGTFVAGAFDTMENRFCGSMKKNFQSSQMKQLLVYVQ
ncbi:MAG: hypothetical protein IPF62_14880 [Bacteroidetes bacterium]|nr:hypothetical protein [Bacteroidota bacterium]